MLDARYIGRWAYALLEQGSVFQNATFSGRRSKSTIGKIFFGRRGGGGLLEKDEDHLYKWNKMKLLQQLNLKKKNLDKNQQEPTCTEQSGLKSW